ncbi:hypothetical protein [Magnetospira sp. QH-2]|uniref:hypothetical protein n=1 Tax=Magnetospira sp. (strain QH-2) TaxID=1288970 RepID=UPI0003E80D2C|nr:hypothetical protein [Magnetospira sp. QH-2]CCQ75249.1 exported protein of unknown function [Magnetospira sp. QH-2]
MTATASMTRWRIVWLVLVALGLPTNAVAEREFVKQPVIVDQRVAPRVIYIENPRFPKVSDQDLRRILASASALVRDHFGITVEQPQDIPVWQIDPVFLDLQANKPEIFDDLIGDFRNDRVDWTVVRENLVKQIKKQKDPLSAQIDFVRPHLVNPLTADNLDTFADAVIETFRTRLAHWTTATLADGYPVIGKVAGRPDLPLNEYGFWTLMAKRGIPAEIVLTNQLVASVEYMPIPIHTSIRGGITGGSAEYNPKSSLGTTVWVSLFPYLSDNPQIKTLRNGDGYDHDNALAYAGAMLAHEMGHQLLQLGHPWSNDACVMRPAEALDFAPWVAKFDAAKCPVGSSEAMTPGVVKVPIW